MHKIHANDPARLADIEIKVKAVSPSFYDSTVKKMWDIHNNGNSGLSITEQLYTARGSQGMGTGAIVAQKTNSDVNVFEKDFLVDMSLKDG